MRTTLSFAMISLVMMCMGCASLVSGTTQAVSFQSVPDEVTVTLITRGPEEQHWRERQSTSRPTSKPDPTLDPDNMMEASRILGKTPFTAQLERGERRYVVFSKVGYKTVAKELTTGTTGAFWGNIISGGVAGSTTDSISGAIYEYEPSHYLVTLTPSPASAIEAPTLYSQGDKVRAFVLMRYASIMADLSTGRGEDLQALLSMLHIADGKKEEAQRALLAMAQREPDRAAFAALVTEIYLR